MSKPTLDMDAFNSQPLEERHATLLHWTNALNDSYERIAAERDAMKAALTKLMLEAIHYRDTGVGAEHLTTAIELARATMEPA